MDSSVIDAFRANFSAFETGDDHLKRCWSHQTCHRCLDSSDCSWCPYVSLFWVQSFFDMDFVANDMASKTWSCVPNKYPIPFLAPLYDEKICPAKQERWELRTRPLGCDCSTTTTISVIVSVVGTLLVVALAFLTILVAIRIRRYVAEKARWRSASSGREEEPLLRERDDSVHARRGREYS